MSSVQIVFYYTECVVNTNQHQYTIIPLNTIEKPIMTSITILTQLYEYGVMEVCSSLTAKALARIFNNVKMQKTLGTRKSFLPHIMTLAKSLPAGSYLYCTLDGETHLDKYALLKLIRPDIKLIWEIHAPVEELLSFSTLLSHAVQIKFKSIKRQLLARFVDGAVCLSNELEKHAQSYLHIHNTVVIPSFIDPELVDKSLSSTSPISKLIGYGKKNGLFFVLWGGAANCPWQRIDVLKRVAQKIYKIDPDILFVILGNNPWTDLARIPNILHMNYVSYVEFLRMVKAVDVSLALYNKQVIAKTGLQFYYSPRKIIDAMAVGTPVIATDTGKNNLITDGINGFLVKNDDNEIVRRILSLKKDTKLLKHIGYNAMQTTRKINLTGAAKQLQQLFLKVESENI